ncbi:hypothetical protein ASPWEDRAFT_167563 [Aspergillus wentii DTO 134E9]|uniref:Uncharacterized protein n=1 Tax=Aspergillus wentii DTO 134E9 TaxID=1073089 RepID=A0A1L9S329_ASPWE|nr:uncharacterized protein ASPWEDRAFT_167563 [Aspergillus wentii DTO 134E9]KAI9929897.1 hypothetical protein MW887_011707 [Aspergillus wentii]OJJ41549.1 hypothetical protein ASPWEDRAFT_167563 [Aspergillus wentii DTO 134E9]
MMDYLYCILCGLFIKEASDSKLDIFLEDANWKGSYHGEGLLYVKPDELEKKYFVRTPSLWRSLYRLIIYDRSIQGYRVTGIGQRAVSSELAQPPLDEYQAALGAPEGTEPGLAQYTVSNTEFWYENLSPKKDWRDLALAIHTRCWDLARFHHKSDIENDMGLFVAMMLQRAFQGNMIRDGVEEFFEEQVAQDPFRHPEIYRAAQKALKRRNKQKQTQQKPLCNENGTASLLSLPLDIVYILFDQLEHFDLWNLVQAIHWPIPHSYWGHRAGEYLKYMDEILMLDLDWAYLCLELERLDRTLFIFRTRTRVLQSLRNISNSMSLDQMRRIERRYKPVHPRDVINGIQYSSWD